MVGPHKQMNPFLHQLNGHVTVEQTQNRTYPSITFNSKTLPTITYSEVQKPETSSKKRFYFALLYLSSLLNIF